MNTLDLGCDFALLAQDTKYSQLAVKCTKKGISILPQLDVPQTAKQREQMVTALEKNYFLFH